MHRILRVIAGTLIWSAILATAGWFLLAERGKESSTFSRLRRYFAQQPGTFCVQFPSTTLVEVGDEVRLEGPEERVFGEVEVLLDDKGLPIRSLYDWCTAVRVRIYDRQGTTIRSDAAARLVRIPQTAAWVVQTLFTEENIPRLAEEWNRHMLEHREAIFSLLTPIVRDVVIDLERHIESELPAFLARHREEILELGEQVRQDFLDKKFMTFFVEDFWPIAEPKIQPVVAEISREIWKRFPLWGLSWRLAYQTLPFTANDHVEKTWRKFLDEEVVPIVRSHSGEVIDAAREITREVLAREEVSRHVRGTFEFLITSPMFHSLSQSFLREVILDNPRFHEAMRRRWNSPEVQRAIEAASGHIEPMVRRMGDIVLGTREEGITREFARVLRSQILLKDLQHLVISPGSEGAPPLEDGAVVNATLQWERKRESAP